MENKTKVAGPLAAAGAVSLGLVLIGACGIGQEDTYVPPPPIRSGPQAADDARPAESTSPTIAQVVIPPSPSWRIAPVPPPRRTLPPEYRISVTASAGSEPHEDSAHGGENTSPTRRVTLSATPGPTPPPSPDWSPASAPAPEIAPAHAESPVPAPSPPATVVIAPAPPDPAPATDPPITTPRAEQDPLAATAPEQAHPPEPAGTTLVAPGEPAPGETPAPQEVSPSETTTPEDADTTSSRAPLVPAVPVAPN